MGRNKGSFKRMHELMSVHHKHLLEERVKESICWICPRVEDGKECQINGEQMMKRLDLRYGLFENFWPHRSPQWDGIFISESSKTLYLIEAKSHLSEISRGNTPPKGDNRKQQDNYDLKCKTLIECMKYFGVKDKDDYWLHQYYQIANRIAFLLKIKNESCPTKIFKKVRLVFLNFVNDPDWKEENKHVSEEGWKKKYNKILEDMGITEKQLTDCDIFIWNIDASNIKR